MSNTHNGIFCILQMVDKRKTIFFIFRSKNLWSLKLTDQKQRQKRYVKRKEREEKHIGTENYFDSINKWFHRDIKSVQKAFVLE